MTAPEMPRPPAEEAPTEYMVVVPSIIGSLEDWRTDYRTDGVRKSTRDEAIAHGLEAEGHDDWLIAIVVGDKLTGLAWQHEDRDDAEEIAEAAEALGLAVPEAANGTAQSPSSSPETPGTGSGRGTGVAESENSVQASAPWIPSFYGSECPHRPEWTCPEHGECRACECDCNTYVADLEEPDLSPIPAELIVRDPEICSGRPTMRGTRILAEDIARHLRAGTTWEELAEWYPWMPIPDAQEAQERPGPREGDTDTGTGVSESPGTAQAVEDLNSKHWLKWNTIARTVTGCQCGFGADEDSDCGFGDSVVAHLLEVGAARPVHYREAAQSLRNYAHRGLHPERFRAFRDAADLLDSTARDLDDEAGR